MAGNTLRVRSPYSHVIWVPETAITVITDRPVFIRTTSPIFGMYIVFLVLEVGSVQKDAHLYIQRISDLQQRKQRYVVVPTLDTSHVRTIKFRFERKLFLRYLFFLAYTSDRAS